MGMKVLMLNQLGMSEKQKAKRFQASCVEEMRDRENEAGAKSYCLDLFVRSKKKKLLCHPVF